MLLDQTHETTIDLLPEQSLRQESRDAATAEQLVRSGLTQPVDEFLRRGGKRFRATLLELAYRIAGGDGNVPTPVLEAVELLHAGSLIIDDIEDGTVERRGGAAMHAKIGVPSAINAGNWLYFRALEALASPNLGRLADIRVMSKVLKTVRTCHEGQALDLSARIDNLAPHSIGSIVRRISEQKTGGLMALAAWLGASAADKSSRRVQEALEAFGYRLGIVLQMLNDIGELARQQPRLDDLLNRRATWPWAWLADIASPAEVAEMQWLLHSTSSPQDYNLVANQLVRRTARHGRQVIRVTLRECLTDLRTHVGSSREVAELANLMFRLERSYE